MMKQCIMLHKNQKQKQNDTNTRDTNINIYNTQSQHELTSDRSYQ